MTQNEGQNFGSSSRALGAFDQRGPYGILIHLGMDFLKMDESQFRAENPAAKYLLPYSQKLLRFRTSILKCNQTVNEAITHVDSCMRDIDLFLCFLNEVFFVS